jgi:LytTr DNA-binding domain
MFKSLIRLTADPFVQPRWGEWLRLRDEKSAAKAGGTVAWPDGEPLRLSVGAVYAIAAILIVISGYVGTFSHARDISWRMGAPRNLWEPALWETTSGIVVVALLPLARIGALLVRAGRRRLVVLGLALATLALTYSTLHIIGMGLLREWAYRLGGWRYAFPWSQEIPYELRKDLFSYTAIAVIFWLAERSTGAPPVRTDDVAQGGADDATATAQLWLRDGRTAILIDPNEIVSVASAGNYVDYQLTGGRSHLIRATLQAQEARLAPFGFVRLHRSRLIHPRRIVAVEWRASGDFEVRLDTGETVAGSRRFKAAVAGISG